MTNNPQRTRNQHYVPQFLLRNFVSGKKKQVWVFDKHKGSTFRTVVRNLAAERDFYDIETSEGVLSIDPLLTNLEGGTAPTIRRIIQQRTLAGVGPAERSLIALFASAQMLRTKAKVEMLADLNAQLAAKLEAMGADLNNVQNFKRMQPDEIRAAAMHDLPKTALEVKDYLLNKSWYLQQTTEAQPFYIGDNPVSLNNTFHEERPLGVAVTGIEIYLPLSSTLQLCFLCEKVANMIRVANRFGSLFGPETELRRLLNTLESGRPITLARDNVIFQNSLQVSNSSRYVYCCKPDFDLAREMVTTDPENKSGPRFGMN